jgi:glycosyltransferase involved in cell wall biosynthesis
MSIDGPAVALLYDDSAYVEATKRREAFGDSPGGLVGRQVAGREFLDAYLAHGAFRELIAVVYNQASAGSLAHLCRQHLSNREQSRRLRVVSMSEFMDSFFPHPPASLLYTPCPPDPSFAWVRHHAGSAGFALSGVTHTLCTAGAARVLCDMVTAPYQPYDALICTSAAVSSMVRAVTGAYIDYLRDRFGGAPRFQPRLETIPLGVNPERFRPATNTERSAQRAALHVADDAVAVLFVGRFTPHAKAHPFPLFYGVAEAARRTGRLIHLILSGWAAHPSVLQAYINGARSFAPGIPVSVVDGMDPTLRFAVWHAADVFASLSDSIQETFGLVVLEAMASGLPVVASDWDGYRDLVVDGETGLLVPTRLVRGATLDATARLLLSAVEYDGFLAECNQATVVDPEAAAAALSRLLSDEPLRRRMGDAGRQRVLEHFTWAGVIRAYEALWQSQETQRRDFVARGSAVSRSLEGPPCYPGLEVSFEGYPSGWLNDETILETAPGAEARLATLLASPLTSYARERRLADEAALRLVLAEGTRSRTLTELDAVLGRLGASRRQGRATLSWLLKYGLLRIVGVS